MTTYDEITNGHIRPLNIAQDLSQVADLIELCFVGTIDEEGNDYIRYLRKMALDTQSSYLGIGGFQRAYAPLQGFVYTVEEKIIGNLSLLPFHKSGEFIYLIANVAVAPAYRRKGIARQLTSRAIQYAHSKSAKSAWLQVRDDNPGAHQLYIEMGFQERCRRTSWTLHPNAIRSPGRLEDLSMKITGKADWEEQQYWLNQVYPATVQWNLGFSLERFNPNWLLKLTRLLNGQFSRSFRFENGRQTLGYLTFEKTSLFSDPIWLACDEAFDDSILRSFFQSFYKRLNSSKPISINLPDGRAEQTLVDLGFVKNHTLIWMEESTIRPF
jgi:ribosomal protein S18 acetylase RimI-like enzyme